MPDALVTAHVSSRLEACTHEDVTGISGGNRAAALASVRWLRLQFKPAPIYPDRDVLLAHRAHIYIHLFHSLSSNRQFQLVKARERGKSGRKKRFRKHFRWKSVRPRETLFPSRGGGGEEYSLRNEVSRKSVTLRRNIASSSVKTRPTTAIPFRG